MHATNTYNVTATINAALQTALNAISTPSWLSQPAVVFNWPEIVDRMPCFSIYHMPDTQSDNYQGRGDGAGNKTVRAAGMVEISAWVSRDLSHDWMAQLTYMKSMISSAYASLTVAVISDYTATPAAPTATAFKVNFNNLTFVQTTADPNPAIQRARALVTYFWDLRA